MILIFDSINQHQFKVIDAVQYPFTLYVKLSICLDKN